MYYTSTSPPVRWHFGICLPFPDFRRSQNTNKIRTSNEQTDVPYLRSYISPFPTFYIQTTPNQPLLRPNKQICKCVAWKGDWSICDSTHSTIYFLRFEHVSCLFFQITNWLRQTIQWGSKDCQPPSFEILQRQWMPMFEKPTAARESRKGYYWSGHLSPHC